QASPALPLLAHLGAPSRPRDACGRKSPWCAACRCTSLDRRGPSIGRPRAEQCCLRLCRAAGSSCPRFFGFLLGSNSRTVVCLGVTDGGRTPAIFAVSTLAESGLSSFRDEQRPARRAIGEP